MSMTLGTTLFTTGLLGLAGLLYLMQRLRVRYRQQPVPTTLFWREVVEETRARVWLQRFRHLWAYLLLLAITALLWSAFAEPHGAADKRQQHWLLLDASAAMTDAEQFERAVSELSRTLSEFPRGRRSVWLCGAWPRLLLAPGEHDILLAERLQGLEAEPCPSSVARTLRLLDSQLQGEERATATLYGWAPLSQVATEDLSERMTVQRAAGTTKLPAFDANTNAGITALGVTEAATLEWGRVDLFIEVTGKIVTAETRLQVKSAGEAWNGTLERSWQQGELQLVARGVPARGQRIEVTLLDGGSLDVDDSAAIQLPSRAPLRVATSPTIDLQGELGTALRLDPAVTLVAAAAEGDVIVRYSGEAFGGGRPALEWVRGADEGNAEYAFFIQHTESENADRVLKRVIRQLGIDQIDTMDLARAQGREITAAAQEGDVRVVRVWQSLLSEEFNFVHSRSFPLFVSTSLRWLAGIERMATTLPAAELFDAELAFAQHAQRLQPSSGTVATEMAPFDPVGGTFRPLTAGAYLSSPAMADVESAPLQVALLDRSLTGSSTMSLATFPDVSYPGSDGWDPVTLLALLAGALLLFEWRRVRQGQMP